MKLLVTGAGGALGKRVAASARLVGHEVVVVTHAECPIDSARDVVAKLLQVRPDAVINCAGLQRGPAVDMILSNSCGPHVLAATGVRIVHMSTDGVFGPIKPRPRTLPVRRRSSEAPAPDDVYGRSKLAGEVTAANVLNVRGTFLTTRHGFVHWLMHAEGTVDAYTSAYWNGTDVGTMARCLVELAGSDRSGVVHAASESVWTKAQMAEYLVKHLKLKLKLQETDQPLIMRALEPDLVLPDVELSLAAIVKEAAL